MAASGARKMREMKERQTGRQDPKKEYARDKQGSREKPPLKVTPPPQAAGERNPRPERPLRDVVKPHAPPITGGTHRSGRHLRVLTGRKF
jgi:hypothetical protein